ncbi:hypothetical protein EDB81DRAFT_655740 [Dactylonectria macrodidyma]|uniref:Uncharacterized protein n=1 Tax=Dactylonectria macrodidyma TaxID=307937 RepID=A0A9P9EPC2_9HYPO|nr:hypothetical protein EDB81DRAFT_655740 [Dactylonectria macrodidyma]
MRVTSTEDTGLSESTYELITSTDTESQDDNYTESMGESVGSLDFHRLDDVHSLTGTEHTYDDESVAGDLEPQLITAPPNDNDEHDTTVLDPASRVHHDGESASTDGSDTESESEDDARSRSSLEYTQQSLKTPSIPTPEASRIVDRPADLVDANGDEDNGSIRTRVVTWFSNWYKAVRYRDNQAWSSLVKTASSALPGILCALIVALVIAAVQPRNPHIPAAMPALTTPRPTTSLASSTSQTSSTQSVLTATTETAGLVPLENALPNEWLFAGKKPDLAVFKQHGQFLVRMPSDVKEAWLAKKCLSFSATRGDASVPITTSSTDDGMLIKFPYEESYGTVKVDITAFCRPKIRKVFRVTFDKGIMEGALEITKHLAQDLTELVPAAAQEAERCFGEAKRSLESASDNVLTASDSLLRDLSTRFHNAHYSLGLIKKEARYRIQSAKFEVSMKLGGIADQVIERLPKPRDIQDQAQLGLLDAQISAKLWWLKMIGNKDQHDQYQHKAKSFMAQKKADAADASEARKMRRHVINDKIDVHSGLWSKVFKGPRCANKLGRGKRGIQQCDFVV